MLFGLLFIAFFGIFSFTCFVENVPEPWFISTLIFGVLVMDMVFTYAPAIFILLIIAVMIAWLGIEVYLSL